MKIIKFVISGKQINVLYHHPNRNEKLPVVIYNHGQVIEDLGLKKASQKGYDLKKIVKMIAERGFVAIAPIRKKNKAVSNRNCLLAVLEFLKGRKNVDSGSINLIGFSRGGGFSLDFALKYGKFRSVVIMSALISEENKDILSANKTPILFTIGKYDITKVLNCFKDFFPERNKSGNKYKTIYPLTHRDFWAAKGKYWDDIFSFIKFLKIRH